MLWSRDEDMRRGISQDGRHSGQDKGTGDNQRGEHITFGAHHIALVCRNMEETVKFYEECLGMKLRAVYPMHGTGGAKHCFLEMGNGQELSFIEFAKPKEGIVGVSHPKENNTESAIASLHHFAFSAQSLDHLHNMRAQIKKAGTLCSRVYSHGFIHSFYFQDPNGIQLEMTCTIRPYGLEEYNPQMLNRPLTKEEASDSWDKKLAIKVAEQEREKLSKL